MRGAWLTCFAVAVAFAACGYPDFRYSDEVVITGGSTSKASSSASGGGAGGNAGGCDAASLGKAGACQNGKKCTVTDPATGAVGCGDAGTFQEWHLCMTDADCAAGLWCDVPFKVCKPICHGNDCANGAPCIPATANGTPIANLQICVANCDPQKAMPCGDKETCIFRSDTQEFDCAQSGNKIAGQSCASSVECERGLLCSKLLGCTEWCSDFSQSNDCPDFSTFCCHFKPKVTHGGKEYGYCGFC